MIHWHLNFTFTSTQDYPQPSQQFLLSPASSWAPCALLGPCHHPDPCPPQPLPHRRCPTVLWVLLQLHSLGLLASRLQNRLLAVHQDPSSNWAISSLGVELPYEGRPRVAGSQAH